MPDCCAEPGICSYMTASLFLLERWLRWRLKCDLREHCWLKRSSWFLVILGGWAYGAAQGQTSLCLCFANLSLIVPRSLLSHLGRQKFCILLSQLIRHNVKALLFPIKWASSNMLRSCGHGGSLMPALNEWMPFISLHFVEPITVFLLIWSTMLAKLSSQVLTLVCAPVVPLCHMLLELKDEGSICSRLKWICS